MIGERIWPTFAMKSIGLLFLVAGVIAAMGALFEVNAVWLYGPYDVGAATSYSQPDWYIGFLEGSLRLFPPWETRVFGYMINNLMYSGVLIPGVVFTGLLLVPWIERRLTKDSARSTASTTCSTVHATHRTAPPPARQRSRSSPSCSSAASQDVIAGTLDISIGNMTTFLQIAALVGPPIAYWAAYQLCVALRRREGPERTERAGVVVRDSGGGYHGLGESTRGLRGGAHRRADGVGDALDERLTAGPVGE